MTTPAPPALHKEDNSVSIVQVTKRNECLADVINDCREVVFLVLLGIWKQVYEDRKIPERHWLPKLQGALKTTTQYTDSQLEEHISKHMKRRKYILDCLHNVYVLTGKLDHDLDNLMIKKDDALLVNFIRNSLVQSARALWYKPYLMYYYTHKKDKLKSAKDEMDKMFKTSLKYVARQQTSEMVMAQEALVEKQKHLLVAASPDDAHQQAPLTLEALSRQHSSHYTDDTSSSSYLSSSDDDSSVTDLHSSVPGSPPRSVKSAPASPIIRHSYELDPASNALTPISRAASVASKAILSESDDSNELFIPRNKKKRITSLDLKVQDPESEDSTSKKEKEPDSDSPSPSPPASPIKKKDDTKKVVDIPKDVATIAYAPPAPKRLVRRVYYEGNKLVHKALKSKSAPKK